MTSAKMVKTTLENNATPLGEYELYTDSPPTTQ